MSFVFADGPPGLEGIHTWASTFALNDRQASLPRATCTEISGLYGMPEITDPRLQRPSRDGENPYPALRHGKTIVYSGLLLGATAISLRTLRTNMLSAFAAVTAERTMSIAPHASVGGPAWTFNARCTGLDIPEHQTVGWSALPTPYQRDYTLTLRCSDGRIYSVANAVSVTHATAAAVTNSGTAPADPVVTVAGASGTVTLTDGTHTLTFANTPSGSLVVDFAARTAKVGSTPVKLVVASSDWWDSFVDGIAPGASVSVTQTGGSSVNVAFTPSVW